MASPAAVLSILITANNKQAMASIAATDAAVKKSAATAQSAEATRAASYARTGQTLSRVGSSMTRWISLPAAAAGAASVKLAKDFEESMLRVQNLAGTSQKTMEGFREEVLKMGPELGKSPRELADALYFIRSSGVKAKDSLEVLAITAKASAIGLGETETVADAVTSAMNAYRRSNLSAADATNTLAAAVKFGKGEPEELAAAIGRVIPVASKLKVPFQDVGASLAGLTLQGLDAAEATTALRGVFMALMKPGAQSEEALAKVGLSAEKLRNILAERGTLAMLQMLSTRFKGNEEAMAKVFPNVRALVGAFNLTGDSAKRNAQIFEEMRKNTDIVGRGFRKIQETDAFKFRQAMAQLESAGIELGAALLPIVAQLAKAFSGLARSFSGIPFAKELLLGAIVLGPIIKFVGWIYKVRAAWLAVQGAATGAAMAQGAAGAGGAAGIGRAGGILGVVAAIGAFEAYTTRMKDAAMQTQHFEEQYQGSVDAIIAQSDKLNAAQLQSTREWLFGLAQSGKVTGAWAAEQIGALNKAAMATMSFKEMIQTAAMVGTDVLKQYSSETAKWAGKFINQFPKIGAAAMTLPQRVDAAFKGVLEIFKSSFNKMAGITKKDMARVVLAMQQGPEQGRQAIVKVLNKTIQNISDAWARGEIATKKAMQRLNNIIAMELKIFGGGPLSPEAAHAATMIGAAQGNLGGRKKGGFAGIVPGHGSGDKVTVGARVEPGEALFVLNRNATGALESLNKSVPRFAKGGKVPTFYGRSPGMVDNLGAAAANLVGNEARRFIKRAGGGDLEHVANVIALGHLLQKKGYQVGEHPRFGGVAPVHVPNSYHYRGRALDVNHAQPEMPFLDRIAGPLRRNRHVKELLWRVAGHFDHLHVAMQKGGVVPQGNWNKNQLTTLAKFVGMKNPALMAAIAMAESGGSPTVRGGAGEYGLWQIMPSWGGGSSLLDPIKNARKAKHILDTQGLNAWTMYKNNGYRRHLGGQVKQGLLAALRGGEGSTNGLLGFDEQGILGMERGTPMELLLRLHRELIGPTLAIITAAVNTAKQHQQDARLTQTVTDDFAAFQELQAATGQRFEFLTKLNAWRTAKRTNKGKRKALEALVAMEQALQPTAPESNLAEQLALEKEEGIKKAQRYAVSQAQYKTLKATPFVGPFAGGGVVPGVGAKLATVHGGETITPKGGAQTVILIEDGAVDARRIKTLSGNEAQRAIRRAARRGNRPLPSGGGRI